MCSDSLVRLPIEDWSKLQEAFKHDWPRGISGFTILDNQRKWIEDGFDYGFKVFCPFGDVWNGMVAINEKSIFYEIVILCPKDDTTNLEEALKTTKVIDWNRNIILPFVPSNVLKCIKEVAKDVCLKIELILPSNSFILNKQNPYFDDTRLHPSISFDILTNDHIDLVDSLWPHRYSGSTWYFKLLIDTKSGFGLFKDKHLVSWVFINEAGTLGHMFTLEDHRRQGYAELLLKIVCNKLLQEGKDVFAFALKDNVGASKLYEKVGFKMFGEVAWCYLKNTGQVRCGPHAV